MGVSLGSTMEGQMWAVLRAPWEPAEGAGGPGTATLLTLQGTPMKVTRGHRVGCGGVNLEKEEVGQEVGSAGRSLSGQEGV